MLRLAMVRQPRLKRRGGLPSSSAAVGGLKEGSTTAVNSWAMVDCLEGIHKQQLLWVCASVDSHWWPWANLANRLVWWTGWLCVLFD